MTDERNTSLISSLLAEFGAKMPEEEKPTQAWMVAEMRDCIMKNPDRPMDELFTRYFNALRLVDALTAALGEAQEERSDLLEDIQPYCEICAFCDRGMEENPCCHCEGCVEFVWRGLPDAMIDESESEDEEDEKA